MGMPQVQAQKNLCQLVSFGGKLIRNLSRWQQPLLFYLVNPTGHKQ